MSAISTSTFAKILAAVSVCTDPSADDTLEERKRKLLSSIGAIFDSDVQIWVLVSVKEGAPDQGTAVRMLDQGWKNNHVRSDYFELVTDPTFHKLQAPLVQNCSKAQTTARINSLQDPEAETQLTAMFRSIGISGVLVSGVPVGDALQSVVVLYRTDNKPDFTTEEEALLHVVVGSIGWLHEQGANVSAKEYTYKLSPREREVILHLLDGHTQNAIATLMKLSPYTVGDYIKSIYRKFQVSSRAELLSKFIAGEDFRSESSAK